MLLVIRVGHRRDFIEKEFTIQKADLYAERFYDLLKNTNTC